MIRIGLLGKTNTGKTTFFNAATLQSAKVSTYPFTTKRPNIGVAHVQTPCVCRELKVADSPVNSRCVGGWRFVPIELIDLPGLIKGAAAGKGLGNQFLNVAAQADALLHIVDASGGIDEEGKMSKPGMGNPVLDIHDIDEEIVMWFASTVRRTMKRVAKRVAKKRIPPEMALASELAGLKVDVKQVIEALKAANLDSKDLSRWKENDFREFSQELRAISKPTIIIANKMDLPFADEFLDKITNEFKESMVVPCCSEAELALRRAEEKGFIEYVPGEEIFRVINRSQLTKEQLWALNYVQQRVLSKWLRTGVQFALNMCVFKLLGMNSVYPVEDERTLSDKKGNVLPDIFLVPAAATARDLARQIHSDLAKAMLYALDARTGVRLPSDYILRDRDIVKIVSATRRK
jgi:ribosome-binding ATPase YchF (GTP1/OBG family)